MNKEEFIKLYDEKVEEIILINQQQREIIKEYLKSIGLTYGKKFKINKVPYLYQILKMTGDTMFRVLNMDDTINQAISIKNITRNMIENYEFELIED